MPVRNVPRSDEEEITQENHDHTEPTFIEESLKRISDMTNKKNTELGAITNNKGY